MNDPVYTKETCSLCKYDELEYGVTLYQSNAWDGGISYDRIWPVRFCPLCGRELPKEEYEDWGEY